MDPTRPLIDGGSVLIEDERVLAVRDGIVGHGETIDCRGRVVLPGLVNAHAHALEGLFRGCGGELTLLPWIRRTHALMDLLDEEGARLAGQLAATEMLRAGTTAYLDPETPTDRRFDGVVAALAASGIRASVTLLVEDRGGYHQWSDRAAPQLSVHELELLDRWSGDESPIRPFLGPSVLSATSPELGHAIREEADRRGLGIAFHCAEVPEDLEDSRARSGGSPIHFAAEAGLLGPRSVLTHGVHLDGDDIARLAASGSSLVHCPTSNAKLGSGIAPVVGMLRAGLNVALGTDGAVCNDTYDMFGEMRMAALLQKASRHDPAAIAPEDVLAMATLNGARALGVDAGRLAPGALGDVTVVDLVRLGSWPTPNVVDSLVFTATARSVTDVVVGGQVRVRSGSVVGVDEPRLLSDAQELATDTLARAGLADAVRSPWARVA